MAEQETKSCPKCKETIQKGATKCKNCGSDLRNWFSRHKIITVIIILILLSLIKNAISEPQATPSRKQPLSASQPVVQEAAIKITASDLYAQYEANEIAADELYKNKILEVSGVIEAIGKDITDSMYVALKTDNIIGLVQCMLADSEKLKAANLVKGNAIVVTGKNSGKLMYVILRNCTIQ